MTNAYPHRTAKAALLLMASKLLSSERAVFLDESRFCVTRAGSLREVYLLRHLFPFSLAVFSDTEGCAAIRASAQAVRGQWPQTRILILGRAPVQLEDHLYDETIAHATNGCALSKMLDKLLHVPGTAKSESFAPLLGYMSGAPQTQRRPAIRESDPSKASGQSLRADFGWEGLPWKKDLVPRTETINR